MKSALLTLDCTWIGEPSSARKCNDTRQQLTTNPQNNCYCKLSQTDELALNDFM